MIGINIILATICEPAATFPKFGREYIVDYDKYYNRYRLYVRNAFSEDLWHDLAQCEKCGYRVQDFIFDPNREGDLRSELVAAEIGYQDVAFFKDSDAKTWEGNEDRPLEISNGAVIAEAAGQYVVEESLVAALNRIRCNFEWKAATVIDKYSRRFQRLVSQPEYSFLSRATVVDGQSAFRWVAGAAALPDNIFLDRIATGPEGACHPLIASNRIALELGQTFPGLPLTPVLRWNSEMGISVIRVCEKLKQRMKGSGPR